jgi:hypothetical protein
MSGPMLASTPVKCRTRLIWIFSSVVSWACLRGEVSHQAAWTWNQILVVPFLQPDGRGRGKSARTTAEQPSLGPVTR